MIFTLNFLLNKNKRLRVVTVLRACNDKNKRFSRLMATTFLSISVSLVPSVSAFSDNESATIKACSALIFKKQSKLLTACPCLKLYVVGHTDGQGKESYNQQLSKQRAQAVVDALAKDYGIASTRLQARGVGELVPVSTNRASEGRQLSHRVELVEM